jgi:hypothetical protein
MENLEDKKGVLIVKFIQQATTITSEVCRKNFKNQQQKITAYGYSEQRVWSADNQYTAPV